MFSPFIETWEWVKARNPGSPFKKRRFSFRTLHCKVLSCTVLVALVMVSKAYQWHLALDIYLGSLAILGSILIYPAGGMAYIDALFFCAGAATQSGLNT